MLILCTGPDTFRAQRHAKMLESAFIEKHGKDGTGIERISHGKSGLKELEQKAQALSLFEPKRFFRTRNLLKEITQKDFPALVRCLSKNTDEIIVVSVEDEPPKSNVLAKLGKEIKIINYSYLLQSGSAFSKWLVEESKQLGIEDEQSVRLIAEEYQGDSWRAWNELMKLKAGGEVVKNLLIENNVYHLVDKIMEGKPTRFQFLVNSELAQELSAILPYQSRAAVRVVDGFSNGVHPFMQRKLARMTASKSAAIFSTAISIHLLSRFGFVHDQESSVLLP